MKILVYLGHPAHFHLYKNVIYNLKKKNHEVIILIKKKDILEQLLINEGFEYHNILEEGRKDSKFGIIIGTLKRIIRLYKFISKNKPDLLCGTSVENSIIGPLFRIPVINTNEDDAAVVPLYAKMSYPGATSILNPLVCNSGKWDKQAVKYNSYQELAYLHPNHFIASKKIVSQYFNPDEPYMIIRFAKLTAHHDNGVKGINQEIAETIIKKLSPLMKIYITSERELPAKLEKYRIAINPLHMHHVMAFSQLYIGDSQTMAAEAGVLGIPFIRFNDFVGRIGYLDELENVYNLGYGIKTSNIDGLYSAIDSLVSMSDFSLFKENQRKMLNEKIDFAQFLTWFIENYPESHKIMKENPDYQNKFK